MIDKKALFLSVVIAAAIGVLMALCAHFLFPEWANENPVIWAAVIGALCGPVYAVLARQRS